MPDVLDGRGGVLTVVPSHVMTFGMPLGDDEWLKTARAIRIALVEDRERARRQSDLVEQVGALAFG